METLLKPFYEALRKANAEDIHVDIPEREISFKLEDTEWILSLTKKSEISPIPVVTTASDVEKLSKEKAQRIIKALWRLAEDRHIDQTDVKTAVQVMLEEGLQDIDLTIHPDQDRNRTD